MHTRKHLLSSVTPVTSYTRSLCLGLGCSRCRSCPSSLAPSHNRRSVCALALSLNLLALVVRLLTRLARPIIVVPLHPPELVKELSSIIVAVSAPPYNYQYINTKQCVCNLRFRLISFTCPEIPEGDFVLNQC
jgi:hypothetical protein